MLPRKKLLHQEPQDKKDLLEKPEEVKTRQDRRRNVGTGPLPEDNLIRGHKSLHETKLHSNSKLKNKQQNSSILKENRRTIREAQRMEETTDEPDG